MTDGEAALIHTEVRAYLATAIAAHQLFDIWSDAHTGALVVHVRVHLPWLPVGRAGDAVVAICALGPGSFDGVVLRGATSPPSGAMCEQVSGIASGQPEWVRAADIALAYGCGSWRPVAEGAVGWDSRWDGALSELRRGPIHSSVRQADVWLREGAHVTGYPKRAKRDLEQEAWLLTMMFVRPETTLALSGKAAIVARRTDESGEVSVELRAADATDESDEVSVEPPTPDAPGRWQPVATTLLRPGAKCVWTVTDRPAAADVTPLTEKLIFAARDDVLEIEAPVQRGGEDEELARWGFKTDTVAGVAVLSSEVQARFWECGCGNTRCEARHRLSSWPTAAEKEVGLSNYALSAVKGPERMLSTGVFVTGMYGPLLTRPGWEWRLREAPVEFKECAQGHKYEGDACQCGEAFDATRHRRILPRPLLILVDGDPHIYERQVRCVCTQCRNLYGLERSVLEGHLRCSKCREPLRLLIASEMIGGDSAFALARRIEQMRATTPRCVRCHHPVEPVAWCPICRATKLSKGPTFVWVRTFATGFSLDAPRLRQDD